MSRRLVVCAHGTTNAAGRQVVLDLASRCAQRLPGVVVRDAYVDVQEPTVDEVIAAQAATGDEVVVVPLLLSTGYHVEVDIARAVARHSSAVATAPLGPSPLLAEVLRDRLVEAGARAGDTVVLAAAGSSRAAAAEDARRQRDLLRRLWDGLVTLAFGSAARPRVPDAVIAARRAGVERVAVASYLLGPGHFHDRLSGTGADLVTAPLGADERVVERVVELFTGCR